MIMIEELKEIKRLRKKYDLNQKELADKAGVSQSLIAKIEAGRLEPTFSKAKKIFQALEELEEKEELKADEVMQKKVVFIDSEDPLKEAIAKMKNKGISQLPVICRERIVGLITESTIVKKIAENPEKIAVLKAGEVMEDVPPIVSPKTRLKTLLNLLQENSVVIVSEKGNIKGIISKTDLLEKVK